MKKIAALLIMSAMAGQVFAADPVTPGVVGGSVATTNALGLTTLTTVGVVAGVTGLAVIAGNSGSSGSNSTTSTATNNN